MVNIIKWSPEWTKKIKELIKKTEKDNQGKEISSAQRLTEEAQPLITTKDKLNLEITELTNKITKETGNYPSFIYLRKWIDNWTNNRGGHNYQKLSDDFHLNGTNQYGFDQKVRNWYQKTYGTNIAYKNNLYRATVNGTNYQITEEELLTLMARVVKALEKVDIANFTTEFNKVQTNTTIQTQVNTWLTQIKNEAKLIKVGSHGTTSPNQTNDKVKRKSYDFPDTYTQKPDNNIAYAGTPIYENFFEFIKEVKAKETFLAKLDSDKQKEVPQTENYSIYLKGEKYDPKKLKSDYNIEIDENSQELYKTGTSAVNFPVTNGVKDWINLATVIANDDNKVKLLTSLDNTANNNPNRTLLADLLASLNANNSAFRDKDHPHHPNTFQKNGHNYGLDAFPKSLEELENLLDKAESQRNLSNVKVVKWEDDLLSKNKQLTEKETEINQIETQINNLLKEELTNLRTQVKSHGVEPGQTFSLEKLAGADNRRTIPELIALKTLLENIRFAEKGDEQANNTISEENTAYNLISQLLTEYTASPISLWKDLEGQDDQEKITKLAADKSQRTAKLTPYFNSFEKWAKKLKFTPEQTASYQAIKVELGQEPNETEKLSDWQTKLKELDPLLTENIITEAVMKDWQTQNNFKTLPKVESQIKKVFINNKLDEDFAKLIKQTDPEITDIAKLFTKLKAPEIISLIEYFGYDKLATSEKEQRKNQLKWTLQRETSEAITEEEIRTTLYEIAIGNKTLATSEYKKQQNPPTNENETENKPFHRSDSILMYLLYGIPIIAIALIAVFWKKIKGWWDGSEKEEEPSKEHIDIVDDSEK